MGILSFLGGAIKPIVGLIDELHTSDEERLNLKLAITTLHNSMAERSLDYESKLVEARSSIIIAEAQSPIWITAAWRPITMLTFVGLIVWSQFTGMDIPPDLWFVIKLGLGGYVGGRSAEKIVPGIIEALKKREEA